MLRVCVRLGLTLRAASRSKLDVWCVVHPINNLSATTRGDTSKRRHMVTPLRSMVTPLDVAVQIAATLLNICE